MEGYTYLFSNANALMIDKILSTANSIISNVDAWPLKNVVLVP